MSITPAPSEISAELMLNKIMNNQVKTSTGKTITSAGRSMSSHLASTGYAAGAAAGSVASGEGYVLAAQAQTSEMLAKIKAMQSQLISVNSATPGFTDIAKGVADIMSYVDTLTKSKVGTQELFTGGTAKSLTLEAGMGAKITILGRTISTGTGALKVLNTAVTVLGTATAYSSTKIKAVTDAIDDVIAELNIASGDYGIAYNQLRDRTAVLNDLATGFTESAGNQAISGSSGPNALLGNMLGSYRLPYLDTLTRPA